MKYNNDSGANEREQNEQNQQNQQPTGGQPTGGQPTGGQPTGGQPVQGPEAASKRDVQEAESKAEEAQSHAEQVHAELYEEVNRLEEEVTTLRQLHAAHALAFKHLFTYSKHVGMTGSHPEYTIPEELEEEVEQYREVAADRPEVETDDEEE
jgi:hypothetical protein